MSVGPDPKYIFCDGKDCQAKTLAPVALRSSFPQDPEAPLSTKGWLFVHEDGRTCHFCPRCAPLYLKALSGSERKPQGCD